MSRNYDDSSQGYIPGENNGQYYNQFSDQPSVAPPQQAAGGGRGQQSGHYYDNQGYEEYGYPYQDGQQSNQYYAPPMQGRWNADYERKGKRPGSSEDDSESYSDFTMKSEMANYQNAIYGRQERFSSIGPSSDSLAQMMPGMPYRPESSQFSFAGNQSSGHSTPVLGGMDYNQSAIISARSAEPYPAWIPENQIPISKEEIEDVFVDLANRFGFQRDSMRNMYDHLLTQLDSRASRMSPSYALLTLHADYIGGQNANYRKWYFASGMDIDDTGGVQNISKFLSGKRKAAKSKKNAPDDIQGTLEDLQGDISLEAAEYRWNTLMNTLTPYDQVRQLALYLLCWGEANQVRFMPECLCFIYKCAWDYLNSSECQNMEQPADEGAYLEYIITPLYLYIRDQQFEVIDGKYVRREKDHVNVIGYDDVNQLFWYAEGLEKIVLNDKVKLMSLPPSQRWQRFPDILWKKVFYKTYKETRSWFHLLANFNRIWIIHFTVFWYYMAYNSPSVYTKDYHQRLNNQPPTAYFWSAMGFGGGIAATLEILATLAEWRYVPRKFPGSIPLTKRFLFLLVLLVINVAPGVYVFWAKNPKDTATLTVAVVHFLISLFTFFFTAIVPLGNLFGSFIEKNSRQKLANQYFTYNFAPLDGRDFIMSGSLWFLIFFFKFLESYFFLGQAFRDPIRVLQTMKVPDCSQDWLGNNLCKYHPKIILGIAYFTNLTLFFLDTYLWYIIWNTIFSVARSFWIGISIWTPWKNIFSRMPKRIYSKVLATNDMEIKYKPKVLISQVWNAIVISMYREHLLAIDHVQKLLYHQVPSEQEGKRTLRAPTFFVSQDDRAFKTEYFPAHSEAERRISFFAQSLSTPIPEPQPVDNMPTFTVLIPHYGEKILLSLREIIREEDQLSRVTLLEYLKSLHPVEWDCFVKDTKILAEETAYYNGETTGYEKDDKDTIKSKIDDLPYYCVGFKSAAPEYTLRTRIWASLRSQTLYRTVSGFMNYARALKLLHRVENPEIVKLFGGNTDHLERELERMARRKFKLLISMQRYVKFSAEELENTEFLLRAYPDLQISYLDEEPPEKPGDEPRLFVTLIDGHCEMLENGQRRPKFRIRLSGNPILGDGKSDNQNMSLIFYRGEYIQLIDANQDNYLEECLKIRSVLAEFEEMNVDPAEPSPYAPTFNKVNSNPVAILGAREYIFSENSGILGDVAAGKEQTFGTLFARTLAQIGGKLHYGHPDFLNGIYMSTRGGVSKAQKGLHLNEDIYAGMNAFMRGGRIKHSEYYQCGKGRDLGFGSILNFTTKVGSGMGEQMLSREYYYLGTRLRLDRLLTFYYAHAGFHINNMFIMLALQLLMIACVNIGAIYNIVSICSWNLNKPVTDELTPKNCFNLQPVVDWIARCILSIFIVFFISFVPLVVQELTERGAWRAVTRLAKHFGSLSPLFEVFACQIYAHSLMSNMSFGGARYIGTGRGFATARIPFSILFSRFAGPSIYLGARHLLMLLFATLAMWIPGLIYFWISIIALCISPFVFNPHQFAWTDFFVDYREYLRWLSRGNSRSHANSWIGYCRLSRTRITGYKRKFLGQPSDKIGDIPRSHFSAVFFGEVVFPVVLVAATLIPFSFMNSQPGISGSCRAVEQTNAIAKAVILALLPIAVNAGVTLLFGGMACCMGPVLSCCCKKFGSVLAAIAHAISVIMLFVVFEVMWLLEGWSFTKALLGMVCVMSIQRLIFKFLTIVFLTREFKHDGANLAWWTGKWYNRSLGAHALSQPAREFLCKTIELSHFSADFILGHVLLFFMSPFVCIPYVDKWHSMILFWLRPSRQIRPPIFSLKQNKLRRRIVRRYATLFFLIFVVFLALIIAPSSAATVTKKEFLKNTLNSHLNISMFNLVIQPLDQNTTNCISGNTTN